MEHLGIEYVELSEGRIVAKMPVDERTFQPMKRLHGGATMALLDVAMAVATRSDTPALGVVTIEMKTTFMQPARGALVARGQLLHRTGSMAYAEGALYDAEGRLCSHATGTFKYMHRRAGAEGGGKAPAQSQAAFLPGDG